MFDNNWDLINGDSAHLIEALNQANQINVIEALVHLLTHHQGADAALIPNQTALQEIHRTGTLFLLEKPGEFRTCPVHLFRPDGTIAYSPPPFEEVPALVAAFHTRLMEIWAESDALGLAAYALWRINWIHPFKNGNGRCARAFAYACLCMKVGFVLPGSPTILDLIMASKPQFEAALAAADAHFAATGEADVSELKAYLMPLFIQQLSSVPAPDGETAET